MKLISKHKDYYDSAAGFYASDDDVVYVRKKEERNYQCGKCPPELRRYEELLKTLPKTLNLPGDQNNYIFNARVPYAYLFFCGRIYVLLQYDNTLYWSFDDFKADLTKQAQREKKTTYRYKPATLTLKSFTLRANPRHYAHRTSLNDATAERIKQYYPANPEIFLEAGTPCFLIHHKYGNTVQVLKNPNLRELGFPKHLDAYQCYQELDMYLGNQMAQQKDPVPERTDDLIRDQHGFNQNSFRDVAPSTKKARRKKNKLRKKKRNR